MRAAWGLAALLVTLTVPTTGAQGDAPLALLEDAAADPQLVLEGTALGTGGRWSALDLVGLEATETADAFVFRLAVGSLETTPEAPVLENCLYRIMFRFGSEDYWVSIFRSVNPDGASYFAYLSLYDDASGEDSTLGALDVEPDAGSGVLAVSVPRDLVLDENGATPFPGTALEDFRARATALAFGRGRFGGFGPLGAQEIPRPHVEDLMPDDGNGTVPLAIRLGLAQDGHARLASEVPVRASNGEATTFVFSVVARNHGPAADRFSLTASGAPRNWQVTLPVSLVEIPAGGNVTLPILVATPFAHEHGSFQDFVVELQSLGDPGSTGRVRLGVRYLAVPQPAGHHDTVYLHSRTFADDPFSLAFSTAFGFPLQEAFMNALDEDETDEDVDVPAEVADVQLEGNEPRMVYEWDIPLSPGLAMGLDFDLNRTGSLRVPVRTIAPLTQASLGGTLTYRSVPREGDGQGGGEGADERTVLAVLEPTPRQDLAAQGATVYEAVVAPTPESDYIAFDADGSLTLTLNLTFTRLDPLFGPHDAPVLEPGGELRLPLFEYRDAIDDIFQSLATVMFEAVGPQEALVNPGETTVFRLELMNHGDSAASFRLGLSGTNLPWARVLGAASIDLAAGASREIAVAVAAPGGASDGDVADLILEAADRDDPNVRALARLVATADTGEDHPDMASEADELDGSLGERQSPGLPLAALLGALALLAWAARRRP